jgi:sarcosine/dimethylglycine N-methyltransferase
MKQDERAPFVRALGRARVAAYAPGEFIEQESFMLASEVLALAREAGIAPGVRVLDLCCGVGGPGRFIAKELSPDYLGVDYSASAIEIARQRAAETARERAGEIPHDHAAEPRCRFEVARIPPIPSGPVEVVMLLETILAFEYKEPLIRKIAAALEPGGRFACTVEAGAPLTAAERAEMPDADTVHLIPLDDLLALLDRAGLTVTHQADHTAAHAATAASLTASFTADAPAIETEIGTEALTDLLTAHRLWTDWMRTGRVRKLALVAVKDATPSGPVPAPACARRGDRGLSA